MAAKNSFLHLKSDQGFSSIEAMFLMIVFTLMVGFTFGVFGIIHTGILHSISARNYAFETFRHRANLTYLRDADPIGSGVPSGFDSYTRTGTIKGDNYRIHLVGSETDLSADQKVQAAERPISKGKTLDAKNRDDNFHVQISNEANLAAGKRYDNLGGVNPVWIRVAYGICVNWACQ